jgi:response regulator RpfG family c-di-GMP phosphodiesterase
MTLMEQRDPTVFAHAGRVADMAVALAIVVDQTDVGRYRHTSFTKKDLRAIRYASLLQDIGKVGVREEVLQKTRKLHPRDLQHIHDRYAFICRTLERDFHRECAESLRQGRAANDRYLVKLEAEHHRQLEELREFIELVTLSNEPTRLPRESADRLSVYAEQTYLDMEGTERPLLTDTELNYLTIRKGSLDETERHQIESHVLYSDQFLKQIPWTKELADIPLIALGHHEKLDGSGYPRGVRLPDIPIQTRIITIADIFDALAARDRPHKAAVSIPRALEIMDDQVRQGLLDAELFRLFVESKAFEAAEYWGTDQQ